MKKKVKMTKKGFSRKAYLMMNSSGIKRIVLINPLNKEVREKNKYLIVFLKSP